MLQLHVSSHSGTSQLERSSAEKTSWLLHEDFRAVLHEELQHECGGGGREVGEDGGSARRTQRGRGHQVLIRVRDNLGRVEYVTLMTSYYVKCWLKGLLVQ